ncbi:MAG: bifunctional hydroxymethylpyrimidine kinase/phosphomethylpyrimidine kinase [Gemmatimonadetes bacterium]|nr:bifunctional hydroxymethylpyrimidine kinase/phosphomethylpyrimidine kinase [Gemmatimonadota bacterium]MDA1103738.1 bifunctional hydroxymethylpyrimidine kinase/phosphomethylpyrimidine kinase [Gemmatimonadota bacterium]
MNERTIPIALTIAGSDSGGGAGVQADLKTFHAFGVYGTSAVTAVTAQNTIGVRSVHALPPDEVRAQILAVVDDLRPAAVKTGMLATQALVVEVARTIGEAQLDRFVMDPVMVATSGDRLLQPDAVQALRGLLLPLASLVTPNLEEAAILSGHPVRSLDQMRDAARVIADLGAAAVLVKGGHLEGDAVDLLWDGVEEHIWRRPRIVTRHTHGTGCTLSAAITAGLARGRDLTTAVDAAVRFVARAIEAAPGLGSGRGPINHFVAHD